ncbi:MAG: hypothetical protein ABFD97_21545 [Syntrophobacter sp.]
MKKHLLVLGVVLLAVAVALPAFAIEFKYGGQFRVRFQAEDNVRDGIDSSDVVQGSATPGTITNNRVPFKVYNGDDNRIFVDQRLRLYFSFIASKNLKVVTKFEVGDSIWGDGGGGLTGQNVGPNRGANVGADAIAFEVKNVYVEFNIPNTPTTGIFGVQTLTLLDSWIVDDDFPAAVLVTKLDPFKVTAGYVGAQNAWEKRWDSSKMYTTDQTFNVDSYFLSLDYASGPFKAALIGYFQDGHHSSISVDPTTMDTPIRNYAGGPAQVSSSQVGTTVAGLGGTPAGRTATGADINAIDRYNSFNFLKNATPRNNFLVDLGINLTYKIDWLMAYVNFVRNFGSVDLTVNRGVASNAVLDGISPLVLPNGSKTSADYEGWMIDAGVTYYCGPYTLNLGGFYTTGPKFSNDPGPGTPLQFDPTSGQFYAVDANGRRTVAGNGVGATTGSGNFVGTTSTNVDWFVYPATTSKYFSEIIGGGILGDDIDIVRGWSTSVKGSAIGGNNSLSTIYWRGNKYPANLWTITAGGSWQVAEQTKLSASYWYFGTAEDVPTAYVPGPVGTVNQGRYKMSGSIGHELDFYVDQGIVDGLTLTLVGAYLIADDAFAPIPIGATSGNNMAYPVPNKADNAFELGARLQWNF